MQNYRSGWTFHEEATYLHIFDRMNEVALEYSFSTLKLRKNLATASNQKCLEFCK